LPISFLPRRWTVHTAQETNPKTRVPFQIPTCCLSLRWPPTSFFRFCYSERCASLVWYLKNGLLLFGITTAPQILVCPCARTKSRLGLTLLPLCPQHMLGPWQRAAQATEAPFELVSTAMPHHGGGASTNRTSTAYRSTGAGANGMDCPCLATPGNAALIIASYTRVGACRSVAPYDNGTATYGSTASEHNAAATPPGVGRERC
jgi:hypothetical protein